MVNKDFANKGICCKNPIDISNAFFFPIFIAKPLENNGKKMKKLKQ